MNAFRKIKFISPAQYAAQFAALGAMYVAIVTIACIVA